MFENRIAALKPLAETLRSTLIGERASCMSNFEVDVCPESLDELERFGVDLNRLQPLGDKPFGYRIEPDRSVLIWGGNPCSNLHPEATDETPDEPPMDDRFEDYVMVYRLIDR